LRYRTTVAITTIAIPTVTITISRVIYRVAIIRGPSY
jgi:hypothetical protein